MGLLGKVAGFQTAAFSADPMTHMSVSFIHLFSNSGNTPRVAYFFVSWLRSTEKYICI